jgi:hypothetical protein
VAAVQHHLSADRVRLDCLRCGWHGQRRAAKEPKPCSRCGGPLVVRMLDTRMLAAPTGNGRQVSVYLDAADHAMLVELGGGSAAEGLRQIVAGHLAQRRLERLAASAG